MKTTIKNLGLQLIAILLTSATFAQGVVWAKVKNPNQITQKEEWQILDAQYNLTIEQALPSSRNQRLLDVYEIKCECDVNDLYVSMVEMPGIKGVEFGPNYKSLEEPIDYGTFVNSNLPTTSPAHYSHWPLKLTNAELAWNFSKGDSATIAISDQNYFIDHEELIGKVVHYDTANASSQTHGTAVAIIAAGNTNNSLNASGLGVASHGYNSKLALYKMNYNEVLEASYSGYRVVNMSWTSGCTFNQYVQDAMNEVYENGTFLVAAAGNGSTCGGADALVYPSAFENVFSVSSVGADDRHWNTFGSGGTHQHNETVDLMAPGYVVPLSAAPNWYLFGTGTSYAAPMVTGVVGLMLSIDPTITNGEIDSILRVTAQNIDDLNPDYIGLMGDGRLDAGHALSIVQRNLDIENSQGGISPIDGDVIISKPGGQIDSNSDANAIIISNGEGTPANVLKTIKEENLKIINMMGQEVNPDKLSTGIYMIIKENVVIQKIVVN